MTDVDWTKFAAARLKAAQYYPFLGVALYALTPYVERGRDTFGVDERWRLMIDPSALDRWSTDEVAGVLLHEISHVVRLHADRARAAFVDARTHRIWNIAGDLEINDDLLADGVPLPQPVTPKSLGLPRGKAAEFYYGRLLDRSPHELPECDCGSGAHGGRGEGSSAVVDVASLPPGLGRDEADLLRRQVAVAIGAAKTAGSVGAGWARWAEAFLDPVVDWRRVLAARIRGALSGVVAGRSDYRYHRPARRRVPGVVLPALVRPTPIVAIVIDTSASVDAAMLNAAWTEASSMMSAVGVRREQIRVWSTDVEAHRHRLMAGARIELKGGGGTDMTAGIRAALAERPMADLVVVLTDGETPWPMERPARPVVVGVLRHDEPPLWPPPSWAVVVDIPVDDLVAPRGR